MPSTDRARPHATRGILMKMAALALGTLLFLTLQRTDGFWVAAASSSRPLVDQAAQSELDRALAAELAMNPGALVATSSTDSCTNPGGLGGTACIYSESSAQTAAAGLAMFAIETSGGGAHEILGLTPDGSWQFWFATQQPVYQLLTLPGSLLICAGGDSLNVRASPAADAAIVTQLRDGSQAMADSFVLTQPGDHSAPGQPVFGMGGWYRITAPAQGWVYSRFVTDASLGNYLWHDQQTAGT